MPNRALSWNKFFFFSILALSFKSCCLWDTCVRLFEVVLLLHTDRYIHERDLLKDVFTQYTESIISLNQIVYTCT